MTKRPNVLFFCVDEMRADHLGCMGNPLVKTPNLDRLAARGTLFTRAYCTNPICMPARASIFTGLLPRDHGVRLNGQNLRTDLPTLPTRLKEAGYRTHAAGKLHLTSWVPEDDQRHPQRYPESAELWNTGKHTHIPTPYYGFDTIDFVGGHSAFVYGQYIQWLKERGGDPALLHPDHALEEPTGAPSTYKMAMPVEHHYNRYIADSAIREILALETDDPFFIWCSFPDPHMPVAPPAPYCHMYDPADVDLPPRRPGEYDDLPPVYKDIIRGVIEPNGIDNTYVSDPDWQEVIAGTYGMISHVDMEIGRVLDALDRSGLADDTIVVFISDHGDMMGDHGLLWKAFYTFDGCIRIPLIVSVPDALQGQVTNSLVSQVDLLPTILDLCQVPMPGIDWEQTSTAFDRGAVMPLRPYPGRSFRRLLQGETDHHHHHLMIENDDPCTGYRVRALVTETHRMTIYPGTRHGELFDLTTDREELHNLFYKPDHQDTVTILTATMLDVYSLWCPLYPIPAWNS